MKRIQTYDIAGALYHLMNGGIESPLVLAKLLNLDAAALSITAEHTRQWFDDTGRTWQRYPLPGGTVVCASCHAVCSVVPCECGKPADFRDKIEAGWPNHAGPSNHRRPAGKSETEYNGDAVNFFLD